MQISLTAKATGERVIIPILPNSLNIKDTASIVTFNLITQGEVKMPRGYTPTAYSWDGTFPGEHARYLGFVQDWQQPAHLIQRITDYHNKGMILQLMATGLGISDDVFIESFTHDYSGGSGDVKYNIALIKYRQLTMRVAPPASLPPPNSGSSSDSGGSASGGSTSSGYGTVTLNDKNSNLNVRKGAGTNHAIIGKLKHGTKVKLLSKSGSWYKIPWGSGTGWVHSSYIKVISQSTSTSSSSSSSSSSASGSTYTVVKGDSLSKIATAKLGNGKRFPEIYNLNQAAIDARNKGKAVDKYMIYPGQVFKLPVKVRWPRWSTTCPKSHTTSSRSCRTARACSCPTCAKVRAGKKTRASSPQG